MNVIGFLCWILGLLSLISLIEAINLQDNKNDQQLYNSLLAEDLAKMKRPFCNAFTGCGRKRSFYADNSIDNQEQMTEKNRIPVTIYRALLRAANRQIGHTLDRESMMDDGPAPNDGIDYTYLDRKTPKSLMHYQS